MKSIIKLVIIALLCSIDLSASKNKDPYHLIVEGAFLNHKHIQYTVYRMNEKTGVFESELRTSARKYFQVACDVGTKYIVRFQDKTGNVKFLMINATRSDYFIVDVDFGKPYDAVIKDTKNGYSVTPIDDLVIKPGQLAQK